MDEMLEIIRRFWSEDAVEFHGEFFDFGPAGVAPHPLGHVPIWVGGKSAAALERAARHEGWLGMNYDLDEIYALLGALAEARSRAADAGHAAESFETFVIPNAEPDEALYADLERRGVTATMGAAWAYDATGFESLEAKRAAIEAFGARFIGEAARG
jgi:alkanesulfonate monooxygenase SsuD/methylene tetrahydromethanopterin reductase-like flavin-dependent oxidoreductase (luciferase family)